MDGASPGMRVIVVGLGVQGRKRAKVAGGDVVATVDPALAEADFVQVERVPLTDFDAALVCTPDAAKIGVLAYLLENGKHVLVEKPLLADDGRDIEALRGLAERRGVACYTAYNHRFEPHLRRLKAVIDKGALGDIYLARFFYGNGTARDVRQSGWRDKGAGVLPDLGSHLIDMALYLFGVPGGRAAEAFRPWSRNRFENRAFDHFLFGSSARPVLEMETTLISWRNHFTCDVYGEKGSAHIESLCKWGPSTFTRRTRVLPSGRPSEETVVEPEGDPTWQAEYAHFKDLCAEGGTNLENDLWINEALRSLARRATSEAAP